ncbi:MAG: FHA domain-containing protein [Dehalococcoidia bacterium]|nr:FHA domain-containing protein [Dehalococcoidia bacterium]
MSFIDWEPMARAGLFGGIFLLALFAVLWVWYDSAGGEGNSWTWRIAATLLVVLTVPAIVLGAANLDAGRETLLTVFAWLNIGAGVATFLTVAAYATWGRATAEPPYVPAPGNNDRTVIPERTPTPPPTQPAAAPKRPVRADAYLVAKAGPEKGRQFPLDGTVVIGRSGQCDIQLEDRRVSTEHAQVKHADGAFIFTDLRSTNGSFLLVEGREEQIRTAQVLIDGDELRIGHTVLQFVDATKAGR